METAADLTGGFRDKANVCHCSRSSASETEVVVYVAPTRVRSCAPGPVRRAGIVQSALTWALLFLQPGDLPTGHILLCGWARRRNTYQCLSTYGRNYADLWCFSRRTANNILPTSMWQWRVYLLDDHCLHGLGYSVKLHLQYR